MTLEQKLENLTENEEEKRGEMIIEIFNLKRQKLTNGLILTAWGSKTPLGIYRMAKRLVLDGE